MWTFRCPEARTWRQHWATGIIREYVGANFEVGYEKGAFLQAGIIVRFNVLGK